MRRIKLFEDFDPNNYPHKQGEIEFPPHPEDVVHKVKYESPLYVTELWADFWEKCMQYMSIKEFMAKAREMGMHDDFGSAYKDWEDGLNAKGEEVEGDDKDQAFWDSVWDDVKNNDRAERMDMSNIDAKDIKGLILHDFNEANLAQYATDEIPTLKKLEAVDVTVDCKFVVEATYTEKPTEEVIQATKDYLEGQYSDGWGEGFEQQDINGGDFENRGGRGHSRSGIPDFPSYHIHAWDPTHGNGGGKKWEITVVKEKE